MYHLHWTLRFVEATPLPRTPFEAVQTYVPPSFLLTLEITSSFPDEKVDPPALDHCMVGSGKPLALQKKVMESPSTTVGFIGVIVSMIGDAEIKKEYVLKVLEKR